MDLPTACKTMNGSKWCMQDHEQCLSGESSRMVLMLVELAASGLKSAVH